jgi:hydrogenase maturation protease
MGIKDKQPAGVRFAKPVASPFSILVLGLGNPILGDDGVGWKVAEQVEQALRGRKPTVDVDFVSLGGLSLMERMLGYERVILIDSIETRSNPEGAVSLFPLAALQDPNSGHTASAHDTSLTTALRTAEAMGAPIPSAVDVVAIEARMTYDFSETLSASVAAAVPIATRKVLELVDER